MSQDPDYVAFRGQRAAQSFDLAMRRRGTLLVLAGPKRRSAGSRASYNAGGIRAKIA